MKKRQNVAAKIIVNHSRISSCFLGKIPTLEFLKKNSVFFALSISLKFLVIGLNYLLGRVPRITRNKSAKFTYAEPFSNKSANSTHFLRYQGTLTGCLLAMAGYSATSQTPYGSNNDGGLLDKWALSSQY